MSLVLFLFGFLDPVSPGEMCKSMLSSVCAENIVSMLCLFHGDLSTLFVILVQVFVNARLHVSGGTLGGDRMVEDASSVAGQYYYKLAMKPLLR